MAESGFDLRLGASYTLLNRLGSGAAGDVWRGLDQRDNTPIAAKILHSQHVEDRDLVDRFLRERTILTRLRHPNIVGVKDLVVEGDRLAIVMEFVDGGALRDLLAKSGPMPPAIALPLTAAVLDGLAAAHEQHVVHRDVKPDNVLLSKDWQALQPGAVKLSDFGISRLVADRESKTTGLLGTPEYMAPELLVTGAGEGPADVYGAGIMLYELLAGRTPFDGKGTSYAIAHRHVSSMPPRLDLPDELWQLIERMLAKDPDLRPTAREAAGLLRAAVPGVRSLPPLPRQSEPDSFELAGGPATEVRGLQPDTPDPASDAPESEMPDLGEGSGGTMVKPMPKVPKPAPRPPRTAEEDESSSDVNWRDPKVIAMVLGGVLILVGGLVWALTGTGGDKKEEAGGGPIEAEVRGEALPTGLTIDRAATWDPGSGTATVTLTYHAQKAALKGPFLEVLPGVKSGGDCAKVEWDSTAGAKANLPSTTGIDAPCAWSVDPSGGVPAEQSVEVTAEVALPLDEDKDPKTALSEWLDQAAAATEDTVNDGSVVSTAYPAQRIQDIQVETVSTTVSGKTLDVNLLPVWPSGPDELNPLYVSPSTGDASSMLTAIAGGEKGVKFSDNCSGGLTITDGGHVAIAQSPARGCSVGVRVGNFTDLKSNTFSIATRGS